MNNDNPKLSLAARHAKWTLRKLRALTPKYITYSALFMFFTGIIAVVLGAFEDSNSLIMLGLLIACLGLSNFERAGFMELIENKNKESSNHH